MAQPLKSLDDLIRRLGSEARPRRHMVSHQSSNLDSFLEGLEERPYGLSFARLPHERVPSPLPSEPSGRPGIVYATVDGAGVDYASVPVRQMLDDASHAFIEELGSTSDLIPALRVAGVGWVNNWNSIGLADELHVLDPSLVQVRKFFELPQGRSYRFPTPMRPQPPAKFYGVDDYSQPILPVRSGRRPIF